MTAVPANSPITLEFQDNRGFRAVTRISGFLADISIDATTVGTVYTAVVGIASAVAAMSNTKLIRIGFGWDFDYAQEPSSESGTYELVQQKARLQGGDGAGGFQAISIPGPKDALFLTSGDNNLIVVNPASSLLTAFQAALAGNVITPRGGSSFSQFFGGQLVSGKTPVRRVLQGQ